MTCELCGATENIYQHHISYKKNQTVPLCFSCHGKVHSDPNHRFHPVDAFKNIDSRGRIVLPDYVVKHWNSDVNIYTGTFSVIIAPTNIDLGDVIKSTEILLQDMHHQLELQQKGKKAEAKK